MKFLILFILPLLLIDPSQLDSSPDKCYTEPEALRIHICWKGPKGKRTCILVTQNSRLRSDEDIDAEGFTSAEGSLILRFSDSNITSFKIDESTTIEGCGANINIRKGANVDVINGLAIIE